MMESPPGTEQRRLLRIIGRMPLASARDLVPILGVDLRDVSSDLESLCGDGWLSSMRIGMCEEPQDRWFLASRAAELLYVTDHAHPSSGETVPTGALAQARPDAVAPVAHDALRVAHHEHFPHLEEPLLSPFVASAAVDDNAGGAMREVHEHPPWTATARGIRLCARRLPMLELLYRVAPELLLSGQLRWPAYSAPAEPELRMTDFRLLRHGGFICATADYGPGVWVAFTYAGLHATERVLRQKHAHRFWGLDCYSHVRDRYFRNEDRFFYEDPRHASEPSAVVVLASDEWSATLTRRAPSRFVPILTCTPSRPSETAVELRRAKDRVSDPAHHGLIGRAEITARWWHANADLAAIADPKAYRIFTIIAEFPGMGVDSLREISGVPLQPFMEALARLVETGLVAEFDERHYLANQGMRRAASLSRVLPSVIRRRHGIYSRHSFRQTELSHDDGVNRLVVQFAREGVTAFAGWRGEINLPNVTQIKPDLLILASDGPFGAGAYCIEFERTAKFPHEIVRKLGPYRRSYAAGRPLRLLVVCETERAVHSFADQRRAVPLVATHSQAAFAGPLTGDETVWIGDGEPVSLHGR